MKKRRKRRIERRVEKIISELYRFKAELSDLKVNRKTTEMSEKTCVWTTQETETDELKSIGLAKRIYDIAEWMDSPIIDPTKSVKGKIPWHDMAIKEYYSWVVKILKGRGRGSSDRLGVVEAPLPDEVQDYLENQEIDFQLREDN